MPPEVASQANVELASGIPFISNADLESAMEGIRRRHRTTQAVLEENAQARVDGLRAALALLAIVAVVALFFTSGSLARPPGAAGPS